MMRAPSRRLLFVQPRHPASLAPIYLAMLSLAFLGLVALLVGFWPRGASTPSAYGAAPAQAAPAGGIAERGFLVPEKPRKPGARTVWM